MTAENADYVDDHSFRPVCGEVCDFGACQVALGRDVRSGPADPADDIVVELGSRLAGADDCQLGIKRHYKGRHSSLIGSAPPYLENARPVAGQAADAGQPSMRALSAKRNGLTSSG